MIDTVEPVEKTIDLQIPQFIELKFDRTKSADIANPTLEFFYEDLLASNIKDSDQFYQQSTKRKLKELCVSKRKQKEFSKLIEDRGVNEREALMLMESFSHHYQGYDTSDPFVDDTEIYEECIPNDMRTKIEGFYLNEGPVEFYFEDSVNSDSLFTPKSKRKRKSDSKTNPNNPENLQTEESVLKVSPKVDKTITISRFISEYIEKWYYLVESTANLISGDDFELFSDPMENLLSLVNSDAIIIHIQKIISSFFPLDGNEFLDEFVADSPSTRPSLTSMASELPAGYYQPVKNILYRFLESMEVSRSKNRIDCPRKPDYEDIKTLFILYINYRRFELSTMQWNTILDILSTGLNLTMRIDKAKFFESLFDDILKLFCGAIDNVLIYYLMTDLKNSLEIKKLEKIDQIEEISENTQKVTNKKTLTKNIFSASQIMVLKTIFIIYLMSINVESISVETFLMQFNDFLKYFVRKLGRNRTGVNQTVLLIASEICIRRLKRIAKKNENAAKAMKKVTILANEEINLSSAKEIPENISTDPNVVEITDTNHLCDEIEVISLLDSPPVIICNTILPAQSVVPPKNHPSSQTSNNSYNSLLSQPIAINAKKSKPRSLPAGSPPAKISPTKTIFSSANDMATSYGNNFLYTTPYHLGSDCGMHSSPVQSHSGVNGIRFPLDGMNYWQTLNFFNQQNTSSLNDMFNIHPNNNLSYTWNPSKKNNDNRPHFFPNRSQF